MVAVTHLELTSPDALRPARAVPVSVERAGHPALNARLYREVGAPWSWTDRLSWTDAEWAAWAARVETWVARADGALAGYAELDPQGADVEVAIFGLLPAFHGRGIGGHLLTEVVRRAWARPGTRRVWLHTCTLDGPHALANYEARGFVAYRREVLPGSG